MNKFLVIKLDQYAGDVDEIVSVALTGYGNDRYGSEQARKTFNAAVRPLLSEPHKEYCYLPIEFSNFNTEHGSSMYDLDSASTDSLRLCLDKYTTAEMLEEMFAIWTKAYGNEDGTLSISVDDDYYPDVVKVIGFELITVREFREVLR
jgi:hypothetical protein